MKQKTIATRHLRTKIAAGYVLILFVIFGIVYNQPNTGETTKVDGSTTWETAMSAMNEKLSGTGWRYVLGPDGLPVLEKNQ